MVALQSSHVSAALLAARTVPSDLNIADPSSIKDVAKIIAAGAMSYYSGNAQTYVDLPSPYYWWETGGLFGAMLDYSHYTGDTSYDAIISTAIQAQAGPYYDYMLPAHYGDEGNDDQSVWGFAVMAAAERNFMQSNTSMPGWLELVENLWNSMASRWDTSTCNGGLEWQIFADNPNGLNYKNSIANGGLFHIAARLARATGNDTYVDWANKVWDWCTGISLIDSGYNVYDGTDKTNNCTQINPLSFTYTAGVFMYGAAVLANHTNDNVWVQRAEGLLGAATGFFGPYSNSTGIMYERACETVDMCDTDMQSFKGMLSRFMAQSAIMLPVLAPNVSTLLATSARAAANTCTGGEDGTTCGQKWYVGGFDGAIGLGEEICALETVQSLLAAQSEAPPAANTTAPAAAEPTKKNSSPKGATVDVRAAALGLVTAVLWWIR